MAKIDQDIHGLFFKWKNHIWRPQASIFTEGSGFYKDKVKAGETTSEMRYCGDDTHFCIFKPSSTEYRSVWRDHGKYVEKIGNTDATHILTSDHVWNPAKFLPPEIDMFKFTALIHKYRGPKYGGKVATINGKWAVCAIPGQWEVMGATEAEIVAHLKANPKTKEEADSEFENTLFNLIRFK